MPSNVIFGCSGINLTPAEKEFFSAVRPWGLILFSRNIASPEQLRALTASFKECVGRDEAMVFIDQEGGRVSRLPAKHWRVPPSPTIFAKLYGTNPESAKRAIFLNYLLIAVELKTCGINANCAPMLDVASEKADWIMTGRALGYEPAQVTELGAEIASALRSGGVAPVIKHAPGHGRAQVDSHQELPRLSSSLDELRRRDFEPFRELRNEAMMMTAHIIYEAVDSERPATVSRQVIEGVLRGDIGYEGLIMSDDLNMQALSGPVEERAAAALDAGCDIALHCSGNLAEMRSISAVVSPLRGDSLRRAQRAEQVAFAQASSPDSASLLRELADLLPDREG